MKASVAILVHPKDDFTRGGYILGRMAKEWHASGYHVKVIKGVRHYVPADILIVHADVTCLSPEYVAFSKHYPVVVNGKTFNIAKRRISKNLVKKDDGYPGPVIVKTDLNFGGTPEASFRLHRITQAAAAKLLGHFPFSFQQQFSKQWLRIFPLRTRAMLPCAYPIYTSTGSVPEPVWRNPHLVVEKFLPEKEGIFHCLRQWLFMGDREVSLRGFSPNPIVKASNIVRRETGLPVPDALRSLRKELGFDYGKFDYGLVKGEAVLYDANWTPTTNFQRNSSEKARLVRELAKGLEVFCPGTDQ